MRRFILPTTLAATALLLTFLRFPAQEKTPAASAPAPSRSPAPVGSPAVLRPELLARLSPETSAFRTWAAAYAEGKNADLLPEGRRLAAGHRTRMTAFITADPRRALDEALPVALRQELPDELQAAIEQRINARGTYAVLGRAEGGIRREFITPDGARYEARVFGRRVRQATTENAAAHGVALDGIAALDENPLRALEPGERLRPGQRVVETCAVSGEQTEAPAAEITPETPAVEIGGEVHILCSGGHIRVFSEQAIAAEGGTGGPSKPTGSVPGSWTTGVKSLLYMRIAFSDTRLEPQTEREAYDMMKTVNDFFVENSHGRLHLLTTVTPLIILPNTEDYYKANDNSSATLVLSEARSAARAAGYDYSAYDLDAIRYSGGPGGFSGQAYVGGRGCWLKSSSAGVAVHEFGHNLGLWHANYWSTGGESTAGSGSNSEYGNSFDTMGAASAGNNWFNAGHQRQLQWIPEENVTRITSGGVYRLTQFDQPRIDPASRYLLSIAKDSERDYWCELRQRWTSNRWLTGGVQLNWSPWGDGSTDNTAYGSNGGGQLLDATPGSPDGKDDSPVIIGRTYSDHGAGIHITPLGKAGTVPEAMDVAVQTGTFPGNRAPSLSLNASALTAAVNESITFTATASDEDGDALACSWDWGDRTFGPNNMIAARSWSTAGIYTVRCEVSDLRGGTRSAHAVVTVGTPAQFTVQGRVLSDGGLPLAGVRLHNGLTGTAYRGTYSDSEGYYTISGLAAGSYTFGAASPTHTFTAALSGPLEVNAPVTAADWTATARPQVVMTLPDASATEGGEGALLRFTRIAPTNAGALTIRLFTGGSATLSDADFTPAETYELGHWKFTLPDGQESLNVAVTAFNDSTAEGPETLIFYLMDGSGYIPSGPEFVHLTIEDNDTPLPVVSLAAVDNSTSENGDPALLRFIRTGDVSAALNVTWTRSGTASAGSDYTAPASGMSIPAGFNSVDVPLTALDDPLVEGTENVVFTLASSAAFLRAPLAQSATVTILDDDLPTVTITASDAAAAELNSDPAVFIVSRTGDLTQPLTVDYALSGTALHGTDYLPLPGTLTIPAGLANAALTIVPLDDAIGEPAQSVTIQLRSTARYLPGTAFSASAAITDNDAPMVSVNISDGKLDEAGGTGKFKITAQGTGSGSITVRYTLTGTATEGTDYPAQSGTLSVPRSGYSEITITPAADAEPENEESIILTILPDPAYTLSLETSAALHIHDGGVPAVNVSAAAASYDEGATARFYFTRAAATAEALTIPYTLSGTAAPGDDFTTPSGSVTIAANATGAFVDVPLIDDLTAEGAESLVLTPAPGSYSLRTAEASLWIHDRQTSGLPEVTFAASSGSHAENTGTVLLTVNLSAPQAVEVRAGYTLNGGSAFHGADFTAAAGTLIFAPGITSLTIPVTLIDDAHLEPAETVIVRLLRATSARIGNTSSHTLTITDNDPAPAPIIGFAAPSSTAGEAAGLPPQAIVYLSAAQPVNVTVDWTAEPGTADALDVTALTGSLTFLPGETAKVIPLTLIDDTLLEPNETLSITLTSVSAPALPAPPLTHTLTIQDNDNTSVSLSAAALSAAETGPVGVIITVTRVSQNLTATLTVPLSVSGSASAADYAPLPAEVTVPAGETAASFTLTPADDADFDPGETVILAPAASALYTVTGSPVTLTILDNETGLAVTAPDASAAEPDDAAAFLITRSGPLEAALTVTFSISGTATADTDYSALPAEIIIPAGQSTAQLDITPLDDLLPEPAELVTLTLTPSPAYVITTPAASAGLADDDTNIAPQVAIVSPAGASVFLPSGPGLLLDATVTDDGRPAPSVPPVITWEQISGDGTATFGDSGSADTSVTFSAPGAYLLRLSATDGELTNFTTVSVFVMSNILTGGNIGTASTATGLSGSGSTWTLTGAGSGAGTANTDGLYYAAAKMSGDFTLTARVTSIAPAGLGASARCGVMIRSGTGANVRHAFMSVSPSRSSFVYRAADGAAGVTNNTNTTTPVPRFVRLRRTGNSFSAAHSVDGLTWTTQGSTQTIVMADPVYAGLAATPASTTAGATVTATFDQYSLTRTGNVAPFVEAGPELSTPFSAILSGIVTDDTAGTVGSGGNQGGGTGPAVLWEMVSGPAAVSLPSSAAGQAVFSSAGHYRLRLSADDRSARTFDDVLVTAASPFSDWQAAQFGSGSTNPDISGPQADPDNDGLENLAEYALGTAPLSPGTESTPVSTRNASTLTLTWRQSTTATDVLIVPLWSADAVDWQTAGLTTETTATGEGWVERRATLDITTLHRAQMRLRVTLF